MRLLNTTVNKVVGLSQISDHMILRTWAKDRQERGGEAQLVITYLRAARWASACLERHRSSTQYGVHS